MTEIGEGGRRGGRQRGGEHENGHGGGGKGKGREGGGQEGGRGGVPGWGGGGADREEKSIKRKEEGYWGSVKHYKPMNAAGIVAVWVYTHAHTHTQTCECLETQ